MFCPRTRSSGANCLIPLPTINSISCFLAAVLLILLSCARPSNQGTGNHKVVIQNTGSDTMVNLAQAWAEAYAEIEPNVSVEVSGGGSGTGIAALISGTVDIANCSRRIEPQELEKARQNTGKEPVEFIVAYDALAVYVHTDNPLEQLTIEQLADIYGEHGKITRWSQLSVTLPKGGKDKIILVSRQSNSGTYHYFREAILGRKGDFRLGTLDLHGSKDVVELISRTPGAIGYSGMGYATPNVKMLKIAKRAGDPAYAPTIENTISQQYPIARPLFMYTLGPPTGAVKQYIDWILSPQGQRVVVDNGFVPLALYSEEGQTEKSR